MSGLAQGHAHFVKEEPHFSVAGSLVVLQGREVQCPILAKVEIDIQLQ